MSTFSEDLEKQVRAEVRSILSDLDAYNGMSVVGLDEAEEELVKLALEMY